ncbi:MAG: PKD domain-containing protein [Chitinophagales bacterium]
MKNFLLLLLSVFCFSLSAQTVLFYDDFEDGIGSWGEAGTWGDTDEKAYGGSYSMTESPYDPTYSSGSAIPEQWIEMSDGVDLTTATDAIVSFYAQIDLETGFDYMYLQVTTDDGDTWFDIAVFNGEGLFTWEYFSYSIGSFVGFSNVKLRFNFVPDFAYEVDGMYIDDFTITSYDDDISPPLILHTPLPLFEGSLLDHTIAATIIDGSGISSTELYYNTDGGTYTAVTGTNVSGDEFEYVIPTLPAGTFVDYYIVATDDAPISNTASSETWHMLAGEHVFYDDGSTGTDVSILLVDGAFTTAAAVKVTFEDPTQLVSMIIQTYTDNISYPNDSILIHVWEDDGGEPGDDIITPFNIWPEATLDNPYGGTRIDLRAYSSELSGLEGDYFIGISNEYGSVAPVYTLTGSAGNSFYENSSIWYSFNDFHFRAVTAGGILAPVADFSFTGDNEVTFTDLSTNTPTTWEWIFGDGSLLSSEQNPIHTYLIDGSYEVCLTASNTGGENTICKPVEITNGASTPEANFTYTILDNTATFTDVSTNAPTEWSWDFGDATLSTEQNPTHVFANGEYEVCLTATNIAGSDVSCKTLQVLVGIDELTYAGIQVYPNPASEQFLIQLAEASGEKEISVFSLSGEKFFESNSSENSILLNVKNYADGMYILKVETDEGSLQKTFVVAKE